MKSGLTQVLLFGVLVLFFGSAYFYVAAYPLVGTLCLLASFPLLFILVGLNIPLAIKRLKVVWEVVDDQLDDSPTEESQNWDSLGPNWVNHPHGKNATRQNKTKNNNERKRFYQSTSTTKTNQQTTTNKSTQNPVQTESSKEKNARNRLTLTKGFTQDELEETYRNQVKEKHPDTKTGSTEEFKQLQEDYQLLKED